MTQLPPPTEDPAVTHREGVWEDSTSWSTSRFDLSMEDTDLDVTIRFDQTGPVINVSAGYDSARISLDQARRLAAFLTAEIDRIEASDPDVERSPSSDGYFSAGSDS